MKGYFITDLDVRKKAADVSSDGRGTWILTSDLIYHSWVLKRTITVPAGFVTDFASVPRLPIAFLLAGDEGHAAAVLHDWLYTAHICTRAEADEVFLEALEIGGEPWWRRNLMWLGVRVGGGSAWDAAGPTQP